LLAHELFVDENLSDDAGKASAIERWRHDLFVDRQKHIRGRAFAQATGAVAKNRIVETLCRGVTKDGCILAPTCGFDSRKR
jgi:hypothetical protein